MFGKNRDQHSGHSNNQRGAFIKNALTASSLLSVAVLILIAPDFYHLTKGFVWDFLASRYPAQLTGAAFLAFYALVMPALFYLGRASMANSAAIGVLWIADKIF